MGNLGREPASLGRARVIASSPKALLVQLVDYKEIIEPAHAGKDAVYGDPREVWVPKSVIHDDSEVYDDNENDAGELFVHQWWADKEGL